MVAELLHFCSGECIKHISNFGLCEPLSSCFVLVAVLS